tara:strand:- start:6773 stop:6931 length:159 start_codon:yes stop_codon:yes gene_type:complete
MTGTAPQLPGIMKSRKPLALMVTAKTTLLGMNPMETQINNDHKQYQLFKTII